MEAENINKDIIISNTVLGTCASIWSMTNIWSLTNNLRWKKIGNSKELQQMWQSNMGLQKWETIEMVDSDE
jgi:hypothetical protein